MVSEPLVILNVILCTAIVVRTAFFRRRGERQRVFVSWLALGIITLYASVPIRFFINFILIPIGGWSPSI